MLVRKVVVLAALFFGALAGPIAAPAAPAVTLTTDTQAVEAGLRFAGTAVRFAGKCPPGSDVYVRVLGPVGKTSLSKRGQKGGVWLTVETVTINNAPRFFWLLGSADPAGLPAARATAMAAGLAVAELFRRINAALGGKGEGELTDGH